MSETNHPAIPESSPTRADVLRESWPCATACRGCEDGCGRGGREPDPHALADEVLRLRGYLAALAAPHTIMLLHRCAHRVAQIAPASGLKRGDARELLTLAKTLAALREGGSDGTV